MNQLESDLRAVMHEQTEQIRTPPVLLSANYHPQTRRLRPRFAIGGGLAGVVGVVVAVVSLAGGAGTAFAGWSPQPTTATAAQLATASAYCAKNVPTSGLPLVLTDTRGPFTFEIYSAGGANDFCTTGPSFTNASGWTASPAVVVPAGRLFVWSEHSTADSGDAYGYFIAQAADDVSAATLTLDDGTQVTATVENGWAVAWWPGVHQVTSAATTTASGTETQTFPLNSCGGASNCTGLTPEGAADGGPGGG